MLIRAQVNKVYQSCHPGMSIEGADFLLVASSGAFSDTVFHVSGKCVYPISQFNALMLLYELQKAILDFFLLTSSSGTVPYLMGGLECSRKSQHCSVIKD